MIAGTAFDLVAVQDAWPRFHSRARRSRTDAATLASIWQRCADGDALCLECPDGLVIVAASLNSSGTMVAEVLLAVSRGRHGAFQRHEADLVAIARDLGAQELAFRTDRPAWRRVLGPHWAQRDDDTFWRST